MKKLNIVFLILIFAGFVLPLRAQQSRGSDTVIGETEYVDARQAVRRSGKTWAVFIAIDDYREWGKLNYPVKDATEIRDILRQYYYIDEVRELYNSAATASAIRRLFTDLQQEVGPNDSVFVFHAGHGTDGQNTRTPSWIPYDGGIDIYAQTGWLYHSQIRSMLDSLKARHVFLISDSCYSGDLLVASRGGSLEVVSNYPAAYDRVSRQVMASGASGEEVSDVSEFASRLRNVLERTETPYITPDYLFYHITNVTTMRQLYTMPNLAAIPGSGHEIGGSFLFFRRNPTAPQTPLADNAPPVTPVTPVTPVNIVQGTPGTREYFIGSWTATVEHNNSYDTYEVTLSANGRCTVKITNDTAVQEATGNWEFDGTYFSFRNVIFRNPPISYQQNFNYTSIIVYGSGNFSFNFMGRAATNGSPVRFTFFRE